MRDACDHRSMQVATFTSARAASRCVRECSAASAAPRTGVARGRRRAGPRQAAGRRAGRAGPGGRCARRPRLAWQPDQPVNPASVTKLVTTVRRRSTCSGRRGPGPRRSGCNGDGRRRRPSGRSRDQGHGRSEAGARAHLAAAAPGPAARACARSAATSCSTAPRFVVPEQSPADFDGEPLRPYNVRSDALLLNYRSVLLTFTPDPARGDRAGQRRSAARRRRHRQRACRSPADPATTGAAA